MKKHFEKMDSSVIVILCTIFLVIIYFCISCDDFLQKTTKQIDATSQIDEIVDGVTVRQDFICPKDNFESIKLLIGTYQRENTSELTVALHEGNQCINSWNVQCKTLIDSQYYTFKLEKRINNSKGKRYTIEITCDAQKGNGITIFSKDTKKNKGLCVNNEPVNQTLCYQINYKENIGAVFSGIYIIPICVLLIIAIFLFGGVNFTTKIKIEKMFLFFWILISIAFSSSNAIFNVPDEGVHFCRILEISEGRMISQKNNLTKEIGGYLPMKNFNVYNLDTDWKAVSKINDIQLDEEKEWYTYAGSALYSPVTYLPQSIGMFIAKLFTKNLVAVAYAGRIANWLCITVLLLLSIKIIPVGKEIISLIALLPMNIHESVSLAPDGMVVALSMLMIAYVLYLKYQFQGKMNTIQVIILYIMAVCMSLYKIVYIPFCLLYFLIPKERFGGMRKKIIHAIIMAILSVGFSISWLQMCSGFLSVKGTNAAWQLKYILLHPINFVIVVCRTYLLDAHNWLLLAGGNKLAHMNVSVSGILITAYLSMLMIKYVPSEARKVKQTVQKIIFSLVIVSVIMLISASLYVQWTPPYLNLVLGIQGRYFIALFLPLYFVFNSVYIKEREYLQKKSMALVSAVNMCACISLLFACI